MDDKDEYADVEQQNNEAENEVVQTLQNKAESWAKLIAILGGEIAFHKCAWQMIGWNYYVCPLMIKMRSGRTIKLTDREGNKTNIDQPNVGLGCRLAPDGGQQHESRFLEKQCQKIYANLRQMHSPLMKHINTC